MIRALPNIITSFRILGTLVLFFLEPLSPAFYIIYTLAGISDVLDGCIARGFHLTSDLGARLDSIADILFYAVMLFKIFPVLWALLPIGIWIALACVLLIRLASYIVGAIKYHRFVSIHTYLNKITGLSVFAAPYFIQLPETIAVILCGTVCGIGGVASLEELIIHLRSKDYQSAPKSIFCRNR